MQTKCNPTFLLCFYALQNYEEAVLAMEVVRPVMLVTDESCIPWYSKLQLRHIPSLRWHVSLDSPSSDFLRTSSNGMKFLRHGFFI